MEFFNKKEEVLEVKLTNYGKDRLAAGQLNPTYYAFFDDDILYDVSGSGYTELQNDSEGRIKSDTPKFDFLTNDTVDPILMYAFEFSAKVTQQDIADMWQNLPPDINEKFEQKEVVIDDKQVLDLLINNSEDIQWMVFKVKKRAKKSFEKYRRSLVTEDTSAFLDIIGPYSYNWPYDYFSLVELVKIDETVQYASVDVTGDDS